MGGGASGTGGAGGTGLHKPLAGNGQNANGQGRGRLGGNRAARRQGILDATGGSPPLDPKHQRA